jgi:hypothetical protein
MSSIQSWRSAWRATISSVPSVEPSPTITQRSGRTLCATTLSIVSAMRAASLRAGVTST